MMDEGYWKSLLRDAEGDLEASTVNVGGPHFGGESLEGLGGGVSANLPGELKRWSQGTDGPDETDWQRAATLLASGETITVIVSGYNREDSWQIGRVQGFLPASPRCPILSQNRLTALAGVSVKL
jgi:hypothetical protein